MNIFGGQKKSHAQVAEAAKADLDAATKALEAAKAAQAKALEKLGAEVEALSARFAETGEPEDAQSLSVARGILADVEAWHLAKIEELTTAKADADEVAKTASGTATAARLLAETVTRSKNLAVLNKRLEGVLAAIRKAPLSELKGEAMPELKDPFIRAEVERLLPEILEANLLSLTQTGIKAYGNDAAGLEKALNVPASELFDAKQFEFYEMAERSLSELLAAIKGAHDDLKKRGAAEEKEALRKEKERIQAEEAQRVAEERAAIAASLKPGLDRLAEVADEYLKHLTPESALRAIEGYGSNPKFAHDARDRLMAARRMAPQDGKPLPCHPGDLEWNVILARKNLLWSKTLKQVVGEDSRIVDVPISEEAAMGRLVTQVIADRRRVAA